MSGCVAVFEIAPTFGQRESEGRALMPDGDTLHRVHQRFVEPVVTVFVEHSTYLKDATRSVKCVKHFSDVDLTCEGGDPERTERADRL